MYENDPFNSKQIGTNLYSDQNLGFTNNKSMSIYELASSDARLASVKKANRRVKRYKMSEVLVEDADTLILPGDEVLRLKGSDAPETSLRQKFKQLGFEEGTPEYKDYRKKALNEIGTWEKNLAKNISQAGGIEATQYAEKILRESDEVYIVRHGKDAYERTLSEIYTGDGRNLATELVREGLAVAELPTSQYFEGTAEDYERVELMIEAAEQGRGIFADDNAILPSDFRSAKFKMPGSNKVSTIKNRIQDYKNLKSIEEKGVGNKEYAYILANKDTYFTIPASLGASAHYGRSLENNLMKQNGYDNLADGAANTFVGIAESMMSFNKEMLQDGAELGAGEKFVVRAYDRGLHAGGVGNWLNREVFMPMGWGRVYKDEKGALPSIAGLAGRILDESYLYYANMNPDFALIGNDYKSGMGYASLESESGMFQTLFEDTTAFAVSVAQSLGMYVAITQPMEMLRAEMNRAFLDSTISGTIVDNTGVVHKGANGYYTSGAASHKNVKAFANKFMAEYYFGDLAGYADMDGGMTAAVINQHIYNKNNQANGRRTAMFDHEHGNMSAFKAQQFLTRGRSRRILEGTFVPFLVDLVNPYDHSTTIGRHSYDEFNRRVHNLVSTISQPVDINIRIKTGQSVVFEEYTDQSGNILQEGNRNSRTLTRYSEIETNVSNQRSIINKNIESKTQELQEFLNSKRAGGAPEVSRADVEEFIRTGKAPRNANINPSSLKEAQATRSSIQEYRSLHSHLNNQLASYADRLEFSTTNTGSAYKTNVASALQDVLNMIPVNPLKWGMVSRSLEEAGNTTVIGQLFSFREAAAFTEQLLTGQTGITKVFKEFEPTVPTIKAGYSPMRNLSNVVNANIFSADRIAGKMWEQAKATWTGKPSDQYVDVDNLTKEFRKAERRIHYAAKKAGKKGFQFKVSDSVIDATQNSADVVVADVGKTSRGTDNLLDAVIEYDNQLQAKGLDPSQVGDAIKRSGLQDITYQIRNHTKDFSKNIKAEKFLGSTTGIFAVGVFAALALNNIMQSTQGTSLTGQVALALYGEDEDIAISFEGNRYIPTEFFGQLTGWNQTAINAAVDVAFAGGVYAMGYKAASMMKTYGYMPYTFDEEYILKAAAEGSITKATAVQELLSVEQVGKLKAGSKVYIHKAGKGKTTLTKTANGFKTEKIMQSFTENLHTKAAIFASIGLLATNAARESAAVLLQSMAESPDDKNFMILGAAFIGSAGLLGAGLDKVYLKSYAEESSSAIVRAGGKVRSNAAFEAMFNTRMARSMGLATLAVGTAYTLKLVFDPEVEQKGSLDPIVAGAVAGIGAGIWKRSVAFSGVAALAAVSTMAVLNWAGIRVLEVGRAGREVDAENAKLIAQLSDYSAAVLANEQDVSMHDMMMAAYSSNFTKTKSLMAKDPKSAGETQVVAKQAPLPFLQFFVAEKIEGYRGSVFSRVGPDSSNTIRKYTLGIQSGPLFGTSISVELPVAYTPGEGFFGLTYNQDQNILDIPNMAIKVGVWAAATTYTLGGIYSTVGLGLDALAKKIPGQAGSQLARDATNMIGGSRDLFRAGEIVFSAAEKISTFFIKTMSNTLLSLQGTDMRIAYETYKATAHRQKDLVELALKAEADSSVFAGLSPEDQIRVQNFRDANLKNNGKKLSDIYDEVLKDAKSGKVLSQVGKGGHFFVGALIGGIVGGLAADAVKQWKINTSAEFGASQKDLSDIAAEEDRKRFLYLTAGMLGGGFVNLFRNSPSVIGATGEAIKTAVDKARNKHTIINDVFTSSGKIARAMSSVPHRVSSGVGKAYSRTLPRKARAIVRLVRKSLNKKIARPFLKSKFGLIAAAATFINYVRTDSEFGIAAYMDRHIVYDKDGNAYNDQRELNTDKNLAHQMLVASSLGGIQAGIIQLFSRPFHSDREILVEFAERQLNKGSKKAAKGVLGKTRHYVGKLNIIKKFRDYMDDRYATRLLELLTSMNVEEGTVANWEKAQRASGVDPTDPTVSRPRSVQKVEQAVALRRQLLDEEGLKLHEYLENQRKIKAGVQLDKDELMLMENFNSKLKKALIEVGGDGKHVLGHLGRNFRAVRPSMKFAMKTTAALVGFYVFKQAVTFVANQGGEVGESSYLDRLYDSANASGKIGQRRQDGSIVGFEGLKSVAADVLRLITGRDIVDLNYALDRVNGGIVKSSGQRLLTNARGVRQAQRLVKDLSEMLVLDNPNSYVNFEVGGKTLRAGDKGVTSSTYFQLQSAGQDISTATYSMSAKFMFSQYLGGGGRLGILVDAALQGFDSTNKHSIEQASTAIRNVTSMMSALKTSRKYSRDTGEALALVGGDSLASMILSSRQEALAHQAWQPVDSLFTNMFFETMDKAKHRSGEKSFVKFLSGLAKGNKNVLDIFANLMEGGVFENFFRRTAITNTIFFTGSFKPPTRKSAPAGMATDIASLWHQTHSITVQQEMFKKNSSNILEFLGDKVIYPMTNHSLIAWMPQELKMITAGLGTVIVSAYMMQFLAQMGKAKESASQVVELLDVFGRNNTDPSDILFVVQDNPEDIAKVFSKQKGQDFKYVNTEGTRYGKANLVGLEEVGGTGKRYVGMVKVSFTEGPARHIRFRLSEIIDHLDDGNFEDFVETLRHKGSNIRNLFMDTSDPQNVKALGKKLLGAGDVQEFLEKTLDGSKIHEVFSGKASLSVADFRKSVVDNFKGRFESGLERLLNIDSPAGTSHTLLQTFNIDGKDVYMFELLDEDFNIGAVGQETIEETNIDGTKSVSQKGLELRKQEFIDKQKQLRELARDELQKIVTEEFEAVQAERMQGGRGVQVLDDVEFMTEVNRRALQRVRANVQSGQGVWGAITQGQGVIDKAETITDEAAAVQKAQKAAERKVVHKKVSGTNNYKVQTVIDEVTEEVLQYRPPTSRVSVWGQFMTGGKGIMDTAFAMFDVLTGLDVLGAYLRTSEALTNPYATNLDKEMAKKELGRAILTTGIGMAIGWASGKLMKAGNSELFKKHGKKILGYGALTVIGGGLVAAFGKNLVKPGMQRLGRYVEQNKVLKNVKDGWDNLWYKAGDAIGHLAAIPIEASMHIGKIAGVEEEAAWFAGGFMGGALGAFAVGFGIFAGAVSLALLAKVALGVGLVVGIASIFGGKKMTSGLNYATREIMKIPGVGAFAGMTDPYRQIRSQERFRHYFVNSPFMLGYIGDITDANWMQYLTASEDPGGRDTMTLLFGEVLSEGAGYQDGHTAWKQMAAESMIGGPSPLTDGVINNELKIRADMYSSESIGRYSWDQMVRYSDNSDVIRAQVAEQRAVRLKEIQRARQEAIKNAAQYGGASESLKAGNPRTAAVTQMTAARIEQVYKELDQYNKPTTKVTAVSIVTHKSHTANSDLEQADTVKAQSISQNGAGVAPITKNHKYYASMYIDKTTAVVEFAKEQDDMNPILTAEAEAVGANTEQPPEIQSQVAAYNSYKNDT